MKIRKKSETTIETHQVIMVRRANQIFHGWCPACGAEVQLFTADQAAGIAGTSTRTVYRWVESGTVHFQETAEGRMLICNNSLLANC